MVLTDDPRALLAPDLPLDSCFAVDEIAAAAKLDQNEAACDLPGPLRRELLATLAAEPWHRYPQPARYAELKARFAAAIGQAPERVVLTAGCDQLIQSVFGAAGGPGRPARIFEPTYPLYAHFAQLSRTPLSRVTLGADLALDEAALRAPGDRLLALVSPNNPTGQLIGRELLQVALELPRLVLLDEAYVDFAGAGASHVALCDDHPNLLVGRSLSKSLLAGVRLGYGIGHPTLIAALERLLFAPYHLNLLQLTVAASYERLAPWLAERAADVVAERGRIAQALDALGLRRWPSHGNFILFAPSPPQPSAQAIYRGLLQRGVRVRDVSALPGLEAGHLRVTVGTAVENTLFLETLAVLL